LKLEEKIEEAIEASLEHRGYGLVQVRFTKLGKRLILEIDIERLDNKPVSIDDCTECSRLISAILDVEDFIKDAYTLEVSSPGENRPLLKVKDFERFCGKTAKMEFFNPINESRKISGVLGKLNSEKTAINILVKNGEKTDEMVVFLENIKKASIKRDF